MGSILLQACFSISSGNLYGTTPNAGSFDRGAVLEIDTRGKETALHSFWGGDGVSPSSGLVRTSTGTLYGTTWTNMDRWYSGRRRVLFRLRGTIQTGEDAE